MDTVVNWITGDLTPVSRVWLALSPALAISAYFLIGLAIYSVRWIFKGSRGDAEMEARGDSVLANMWMRLYLIWLLQPLWRLILRTGVPPTAVTTLSVLIAIGGGIALAAGRFSLGGWLYIFAGVLDLLDGRLARAQNKVTRAGGALDSILDRYSDAAILVGLGWFYRDSWILLVVLMALVGTSLVPYMRAKGESLGIEVKVGFMQRAERILYLGAACAISPIIEVIFDPTNPRPIHRVAVIGLILLAVATHVTAAQRFVWVISSLADSPIFTRHKRPAGMLARKLIAAWTASGFDFILVVALVSYYDASPVAATVVGCLLGGVINFTIGRLWVFETSGPKLQQIRRYAFVSITSAGLNAAGVACMLLLPTMDYRVAWVLVRGAVSLAWSLPLQREYVFAPPRDAAAEQA